ncbi:pentapeptide repeat-containing protein [filamentous cyanobacterium LEGE 11480]|uniref:Pentapeptide repeat-containing protein n=1 Tax=Romeriopsis navalis LEGE 11480 TaxID=2777977 RepID=A0A928VT89_9CYAN|nr:pentapeptide repeat-containing protein [Romeriopsis navalis]MBE9031814.1 pentapeptide repeat-containing protein [Romeriopsis navalis LEGE 11480]
MRLFKKKKQRLASQPLLLQLPNISVKAKLTFWAKSKGIRLTIQWLIFLLALIALVGLSKPVLWPGGFGIEKGESRSTKTIEKVEKDPKGNTTKTVETIKIDAGKTLWDWLSLLGVPTSLAILGYRLQQLQQKRAEVLAREQRERDEALAKEQRQIAADETKEEVLQVYFDRLSVLLVDKNLMAIAAKGEEATAEDRELLDSAVDVIRARTLSILRRFESDPERKTSVIRFLLEADIVSKLKLDLGAADLGAANLGAANLGAANLGAANLSKANLRFADLRFANLSAANLSDADLSFANLSAANLSDADLGCADLSKANLRAADLREANLSKADLGKADLSKANLRFADLRFADLSDAIFEKTVMPNGELKTSEPPQAD